MRSSSSWYFNFISPGPHGICSWDSLALEIKPMFRILANALFPQVEAGKQSQVTKEHRCLNPVPPVLCLPSLPSPSCWTKSCRCSVGRTGLELPIFRNFQAKSWQDQNEQCRHQAMGKAICQWLMRPSQKEVRECCRRQMIDFKTILL